MKDLSALRVYVKARPPQTAALAVDEARLEAVLQRVVGYRNRDTLLHDLDALTAIHRLRGTEAKHELESAGAVFVITNTPLVQASNQFFETLPSGSLLPLSYPDAAFTTLVWLKNPVAAPALPQQRIIADCYAALSPSDDLWRAYLTEIAKLQRERRITVEDYHLLRYSMEARSLLMDRTLGEPAAFSQGTIDEVLEHARAAVRAQTEAELQKERALRQQAEEVGLEAKARATQAEAEKQAEIMAIKAARTR